MQIVIYDLANCVNYILFEPVFPFHRACVLEQSDRKNSLIWAD